MRKVFQINVTANWGSTGRIAEQINVLARKKGWSTFIAYGRYSNPSESDLIHVGSDMEVYEHYLEYRIADNDGLASRKATRKLIKKISEIKPDIIHLHNIHDHWLNYGILFNYLNTLDIPIVWTQHDCWSFTGGCGYYTVNKCTKWQMGCYRCPLKKGLLPLKDQTYRHYELKKELFNKIKNLTLVPVSHWLEGEIRKSFLANKHIRVIYNGIDTSIFHPSDSMFKQKYGIENKFLLVGVATVWSERKGLNDYLKLSNLLPDNIVMLLVGLSKKQIIHLPKGIIGIERTNNVEELADIYSGSDVVLNLSYEETFGLTTVEGFACGTPGIVYNATASPELITPETGIVVETGDIQGVADAVKQMLMNGKKSYSVACRKRAEEYFDKNDRYKDYIYLYEDLLRN